MAGIYYPREYVDSPGFFLDRVASEQHWGDLANEMVFDVGCGEPEIKLADLLVERYPNLNKVVATDNNLQLIKKIRLTKSHPKIVHGALDIQRPGDFLMFMDDVDKVISRHCLHMVRNQAAAFKNIHYILRPGGQAAFLFCHSSGFASWFTEISDNIKWNKYFIQGDGPEIPVTQFMKNLDAEYYIRLFKKVGFEIELCEEGKFNHTYVSEEACRDAMVQVVKNSFSIPPKLKDEFESYIFDTFIEHNERDEQGRPRQISRFITAMVRKPGSTAENPSGGDK